MVINNELLRLGSTADSLAWEPTRVTDWPNQTLFFQGECQRDEECADTEACEDYYCVNVCKTETCQKDLFCKAIRHVPVCGRKYVPVPQEVCIFCWNLSKKPFEKPLVKTHSGVITAQRTYIVVHRSHNGIFGTGLKNVSMSILNFTRTQLYQNINCAFVKFNSLESQSLVNLNRTLP